MLAVVLVVFILIAVFYDGKKEEDVSVQEEGIEVTQDECINFVGDYLPGKWRSKATEYPATLELTLEEDETFTYEVTGEEESYNLQGSWDFNLTQNTIGLTFNSLNEPWKKTLADEKLKDDFPGVVDYSLDDKRISFQLYYFGREDFQGCEEDRYFIDWLGFNLYRIEEPIS